MNPSASAPTSRCIPRRPRILLFLSLWLACSWFHQGGGWQQNARFAQVRSLVEQSTWSINDFCAYQRIDDPSRPHELRRVSVPSSVSFDSLPKGMSTGDIAISKGRIFPNKPPGLTLLMVPAFAFASSLLAVIGHELEDPESLSLAAWLTTIFSVSLVSALGALAFLSLVQRLFPRTPHQMLILSTVVLYLATIIWPYSTMAFDHVPVGVCLIVSVLCITSASQPFPNVASGRSLISSSIAGFFFGLAVITNYAAILAVLPFTLLLVCLSRSFRNFMAYIAGGLLPALFLYWYHHHCFGSPFTLATTFQNPIFTSPDAFLGVFTAPNPVVAFQILFGFQRSILISCPIVFVAITGCVTLAFGCGDRSNHILRPVAITALAIFIAFLCMNAAFNAWHGGYCFGPRYLLASLPLLCIGLIPVLRLVPRLTLCIAAVSTAITFLATAIDPQTPSVVEFPLSRYYVPLALGQPVSAEFGTAGPVSANAQGMYESASVSFFPAGSAPARWNSFNAGELLFPHSWLSTVPLIVVVGTGITLSIRCCKSASITCC